jgi:nonribosomal peptide synthetase MxcG
VTLSTPLTCAELGIWLGHQSSGKPQSYNCAEVVTLTGPLRVSDFKRAVTATLERAQGLSRRFVEVDGEPRWQPCPLHPSAFELVDLCQESDPEAAAREHTRRLLATPSTLEAGELCQHRLYRLGPQAHLWFHQAHHIALDGYGFQLVRRAVETAYAGGRSARPFGDLRAVLSEDRAYAGSGQAASDREFWQRGPGSQALGARLDDYRRVGASWILAPTVALRRSFSLGREVRLGLEALAQASGSSWVDALVALIAGFVAERTGQSQFALGLPVMLRLRSAAAAVPCVAMNVNRLPLVVEAGGSPAALARSVRERLALQSPHQRFRYEQLRERHRACRAFGPLVNVMPFEPSTRFGDCHARVESLSAGPADELSLAVYPSGGGLRCDVDAHPDAYNADGLSRLIRDLDAFVRQGLARPELPVVARGPRVALAQPSGLTPDDGAGVMATIENRAQREPGQLALVSADRSWTYGELWARAGEVASWLRARGARVGDRIALDLRRSAENVPVALGVLRSGCAYVALDPALPERRRQTILREARPSLVLRELPPEGGPTDRQVSATRPGDPAYVVFTSGSTGTPRGVEVSRAALDHFVRVAGERYGIRAQDRVLQFASLSIEQAMRRCQDHPLPDNHTAAQPNFRLQLPSVLVRPIRVGHLRKAQQLRPQTGRPNVNQIAGSYFRYRIPKHRHLPA